MKFNIKLNLKPRYQRLVVIFIASIISLLILFIILFPTLKNIREMTQNIYGQRLALEKLYLRGQSIRESKENYEKIKDEVKELEKVFNHFGKELDFITALEEIATEKNVSQIINIKNAEQDKNKKNETQENSANETYSSIEVAINLSGDYNNLIKYLESVQKLDFYFNINYIDFYYHGSNAFTATGKTIEPEKNFEKSNYNPVINLSLSGMTYWK